jgi:general L-amino acid transport system substrate-binding protein
LDFTAKINDVINHPIWIVMRLSNILISSMALLLLSSTSNSKTLEAVQKRGYLQCGVSQSLPGFSFPGDDGTWSGLDVDMCRAVAAAIFKDSNKVRFIPLSTKDRFTALQSGEIDLLSRNTTWNFTREAGLGFIFTNVTYYDGQGFMVPKKSKITSVKQLAGATLCANAGSTTELNIADYFHAHNLPYHIITFEKDNEVVAAYYSGRCDVLTSDRSGLAAQRLKLPKPDEHVILSDIISKEPLGPVVREDDPKWMHLVRWVIFGLITAEELGITKDNVQSMLTSTQPDVKRLLGTDQDFGKVLGLSNDFMVQAIFQVGNYGEIFERNVGPQSTLNLERGQNNLWNNGGLMYSPPFR